MKSRQLSLYQLPYRDKIGPDGRLVCCYCGGPVPKKRQCWCSEKCVTQYRIRSHPSYAARQVKQRDKGVCARCGLDCVRLKRLLMGDHYNFRQLSDKELKFLNVQRHPAHIRRFWEMDHILPVAAGGGGCGLDNLQTLCRWCHLFKTVAWRARFYPLITVAAKAWEIQIQQLRVITTKLLAHAV